MFALSPCIACLALVGGPSASDVMKVDYRSFHIPVQVKPEEKGRIKELRLYVSKDRGKTWQLHAKEAADAKQFRFDTDRDGEYWFNVQVVDTKGTAIPEDMTKATASLKVVVDTKGKQTPNSTPPDWTQPAPAKKADLDGDELEEEWNRAQEAIKRWEKRVADLEERKKEKLKKDLDQMREKLEKLKERARDLEKEVSEDGFVKPPATCCKPVTIAK
jgi:hypothetical protein